MAPNLRNPNAEYTERIARPCYVGRFPHRRVKNATYNSPRRTEGTTACNNYGLTCGILKVTGKDVAELLIADGTSEALPMRPGSLPAAGRR